MGIEDSAARIAQETPPGITRIGWFLHTHPALARKIGNYESMALRDELERRPIRRPVFIAGLARSGSTLLLETLATHPDMATHRYRDFPFLAIPYWWNRSLGFGMRATPKPRERAHGDGIMITPESPEALEEPVWMMFFPHAHDAAHSAVLEPSAHAEFAAFYRDHLRKILLIRNRPRYLSKGNYNTTRLPYLKHLFPDARFILPLREPVAHVASLVRQHGLFSEAGRKSVRVRRYLQASGHFEFGLDRRILNTGDDALAQEIAQAWQSGDEARGYALQWKAVYGFLSDRLEADTSLRQSARVVSFEHLCREPAEELARIASHAGIEAGAEWIDAHASRIRLPDYYRSPFTEAEHEMIRAITGDTYRRMLALL